MPLPIAGQSAISTGVSPPDCGKITPLARSSQSEEVGVGLTGDHHAPQGHHPDMATILRNM
jgi:hypothetical protein